MTTKQAPARRRPGRPLPVPDAAVLSQAHRLTSTAETGALLRAERAARGLSQAEMAVRLGISRQTLVGLEAGAEGTAAGTLLRILADLGIVLMAPGRGRRRPANGAGTAGTACMSGQVAGQGGPPALQRELAVWLDGAPGRVGTLSAQAGAGGAISFLYDTAYLSHPQAHR